jgi:hypothetical protein
VCNVTYLLRKTPESLKTADSHGYARINEIRQTLIFRFDNALLLCQSKTDGLIFSAGRAEAERCPPHVQAVGMCPPAENSGLATRQFKIDKALPQKSSYRQKYL